MNINDFSFFPRTIFPLHRCYLTSRTTLLFIFICYTQKVVKWVVELMLHRGGVGSELFPLFLYKKRIFPLPLFQLQIIAKFFNFLLPTHSFMDVCFIIRPQDWILILWYTFFTSLSFDITEKSEINNTNGCSRFEILFDDNVHISYVVKPIVSHQTTIDDAKDGKKNIWSSDYQM